MTMYHPTLYPDHVCAPEPWAAQRQVMTEKLPPTHRLQQPGPTHKLVAAHNQTSTLTHLRPIRRKGSLVQKGTESQRMRRLKFRKLLLKMKPFPGLKIKLDDKLQKLKTQAKAKQRKRTPKGATTETN
jgi:hypothetical protein